MLYFEFFMGRSWFLLVEAGISNATVLSSDCDYGPNEILENGKNGFLYKSNSQKDFLENFDKINNCSSKELYKKKVSLKKKIKVYTQFHHYKLLSEILRS